MSARYEGLRNQAQALYSKHTVEKKQVGNREGDHKNLKIENLKSRKPNGGVQINPYLTISQKMRSEPDVRLLALAPWGPEGMFAKHPG